MRVIRVKTYLVFAFVINFCVLIFTIYDLMNLSIYSGEMRRINVVSNLLSNLTTDLKEKNINANTDIKLFLYLGKKELTININDYPVLQKNFSISGPPSKIKESPHFQPPTNYSGLYLLVLHQDSGMHFKEAVRFKTFEEGNDIELLRELLSIQPGRIVILASLHQSLIGLSHLTIKYLEKQGSVHAEQFPKHNFDRWLMIWTQNGKVWREDLIPCMVQPCQFWQGGKMQTFLNIVEASTEATYCESWPFNDTWNFRNVFCQRYEGYGPLCSCLEPFPIITRETNRLNHLSETAILMVTSNRPASLSRSLHQLYKTKGFDPKKMLVVIDGYFTEVQQLIDVYQLQSVAHESGLTNTTSRITEHYRFAFSKIFDIFDWANSVIVLEEDLKVAPDFFHYFNQLLPVVQSDKTIFCISAWNDFSFYHSASDTSVVQRTDTMPGLGWLITRTIVDELIPKWPKKGETIDWDMWVRLPSQMKGRQCLQPEVLRIFHFGSTGVHTTASVQNLYYDFRPMSKKESINLSHIHRLTDTVYYKDLELKIKTGIHLPERAEFDPCEEVFLPKNDTRTFILWIKMNSGADDYTFLGIMKCLDVWGEDLRAGYKKVWQLRFYGTVFLIIGWPDSPFSRLKPKGISPLRRSTGLKNEAEPPVEVFPNKIRDVL